MKLSRRRFTHLAAGGATLSMLSRTAGAQAYPARPVHMIVPLTAGSAADILARRLAQKVGESWGQTVVVEISGRRHDVGSRRGGQGRA